MDCRFFKKQTFSLRRKINLTFGQSAKEMKIIIIKNKEYNKTSVKTVWKKGSSNQIDKVINVLSKGNPLWLKQTHSSTNRLLKEHATYAKATTSVYGTVPSKTKKHNKETYLYSYIRTFTQTHKHK